MVLMDSWTISASVVDLIPCLGLMGVSFRDSCSVPCALAPGQPEAPRNGVGPDMSHPIRAGPWPNHKYRLGNPGTYPRTVATAPRPRRLRGFRTGAPPSRRSPCNG